MIADLRQYGFFCEGRDPNYGAAGSEDEDDGDESQTDRICRFVLDNYITPARAKGQAAV